ncbi:MAG: EamA family transporter [Phycisphaeraceae bacterium]|nr:EamA family transporter [Phycisphaeraceae bacterium]MBX3406461.1 EamA family transporter [Phycisphaeraceae bacterium]
MPAILLAVAAGLCWGIGELFTKSVLHTHKVGPITAITIRSTVALPVLWLAYVLAVYVLRSPRENAAWFRGVEAGGADAATILKLVCGSGLIAGAAAMICFYAALSLGEVSRVKPIAFALAPATAVVLGWLVLKEGMTVQKALGVALILGGVLLLTGGKAVAKVP